MFGFLHLTAVTDSASQTTDYDYDAGDRLTKVEHGFTVLDGFTYALTLGGNITRTDQADGSY